MRALRVAAVAAAVLVLSGCARYSVDTNGDATLVAVTSRPDVMSMALISGRLAIVGEGCFGIVASEGDGFAAIFPVGTSADGDSLDIPGLGVVSVGDHIEGGGGFAEPEQLSENVPQECRTNEVAYLNPFD